MGVSLTKEKNAHGNLVVHEAGGRRSTAAAVAARGVDGGAAAGRCGRCGCGGFQFMVRGLNLH